MRISQISKKPLTALSHAEMFTLRRSYGNEPEATVDPECTAIVGRTPPGNPPVIQHWVSTRTQGN